jgi:hypothetical protein
MRKRLICDTIIAMQQERRGFKISVTEAEFWTCLCGNQPTLEGFYSCNESGEIVEPTPTEWKKPLYVCATCGRIIHQRTHRIVGWKTPAEASKKSA